MPAIIVMALAISLIVTILEILNGDWFNKSGEGISYYQIDNVFDEESYGTFIVYMVRQNETVNTIIEKYSTTVEELEKYNELTNLNNGTKLIIPVQNEK